MERWRAGSAKKDTEEKPQAKNEAADKKGPHASDKKPKKGQPSLPAPLLMSEPERFALISFIAGLLSDESVVSLAVDTKRAWRKEFVGKLMQLFELEGSRETFELILSGDAPIDSGCLCNVIIEAGNAEKAVCDLLIASVSTGVYDARARETLLAVAKQLNVSWRVVQEEEHSLAIHLARIQAENQDEIDAERAEQLQRQKRNRWIKIGVGGLIGGTLIGVTGGLAAPFVAAGAGAVFGASAAVTLGSAVGIYAIGTLFGAAGAGLASYKMKKRVGGLEEFYFEPMSQSKDQVSCTILVNGWVTRHDNFVRDYTEPFRSLHPYSDAYAVVWECEALYRLSSAVEKLLKDEAVGFMVNQLLQHTVLAAIMAAIAWPAALVKACGLIDNPWSVVNNRAEAAGEELAHALLSHAQGGRPVTLVAYSFGAKVVFHCLRELHRRKANASIVQNVYLFGAPVTGTEAVWRDIASVVAGRIVNGFSTNDWILKYLLRGTSAETAIAGLNGIAWESPRIQNMDLTEKIPGHSSYAAKMPELLELVGLADVPNAKPSIGSIGLRVNVSGYGGGILRYIGRTHFGGEEQFYGIALDKPDGKNDGSIDGVRYFDCRAQHGVFVHVDADRVRVVEELLTGAKCYSPTCKGPAGCYSAICHAKKSPNTRPMSDLVRSPPPPAAAEVQQSAPPARKH